MNNDHTTGLSQGMAACGLHNPTHPPQITLPPGLPPPPPPHNLPSTQTNAQHHTFDLRTQLTELLEQEILDFGEVIQAKRSTDLTYLPPNLTKLTQTDDPNRGNEILNFLLALGYSPHSENPYAVMGFAELDGPELTEHILTCRLQFADRHIKHFTTTCSQDICNKLLNQLHNAHERCLTLLPDIKEKRKLIKGTPKVSDHWRELHEEALTFLSSFVPHAADGTSVLATQLSNVLRQDLTHHPNLASIQDTRELCNKLNGPNNIIQAALSQTSKHLTTWAPEAQHQVLRLATSYRELRSNNQGPSSLSLLFKIDHYPGCTEPNHLTDIWSHPILDNKWSDIVQQVTYLQPPMMMITAGKNSPIHSRKCLVVVTLIHNPQVVPHPSNRPQPPSTIPQLHTWRPNLYEVTTHSTMWIDVPHEHRWHIHSLITNFQLPGLGNADRPRPSLGHRAEAPRSVIHLHFNSDVGSELMQNLIVKWLSKTLEPYKPLIGLQSTISNPAAYMLDITSPAGAHLISHLCDNCILISPRLAIVTTTTSIPTWTQLLTESWQNDPNHCALVLRMRDSTNSRNKKLAEVAATKDQLSASRARKGHHEITPNSAKPLTLRATLDLPVGTDANSTTWLPHMMDHLAQTTQVPLRQHLADQGMELGTWKIMYNFEHTWTGKILIQCQTADELQQIYKIVQNQGVVIQGHTTSIHMHSDYIDLHAHGENDL